MTNPLTPVKAERLLDDCPTGAPLGTCGNWQPIAGPPRDEAACPECGGRGYVEVGGWREPGRQVCLLCAAPPRDDGINETKKE
jgi:hypothetical protein